MRGEKIPHFPPEKVLLLLCAHGANHVWIRLSWLCDLAELIRAQPDLDWDQIWSWAREFRSERMLAIGLILAHDVLGASAPWAVLQSAQSDRTARLLATQVATRFAFTDDRWLGPLEEPFFHLRMRERLWDSVRYCFFMASPTVKDWTCLPLPGPLSFLYYLVRPVRLAVEHGLKLA